MHLFLRSPYLPGSNLLYLMGKAAGNPVWKVSGQYFQGSVLASSNSTLVSWSHVVIPLYVCLCQMGLSCQSLGDGTNLSNSILFKGQQILIGLKYVAIKIRILTFWILEGSVYQIAVRVSLFSLYLENKRLQNQQYFKQKA